MTATRPESRTVNGRFVRLEPLRQDHLPALYAAIGHPIVFAGGYGGGPAGLPADADSFIRWAQTYYDWSAGNPFAVILVDGANDGRLVGTTTLTDFDLRYESAHMGWTAFDPRVWGTAVNAEVKILTLGLAFDSGFHRVKIQADALNERSRAAIAGIGATFEGIVRRDRPRADGTWRDTAVFSVLSDEWPEIRAGLEARLERFGDAPVELRDRPLS